MSFLFELVLGDEPVLRVVFPAETGQRQLQTSGGAQIGRIVRTPRGLRIELDEDAAQAIVDAQFDVL